MLIDGRNRRTACKIAGVEPTSRDLNGEDPTAFVLSANIHRRHMTKGQRAMAVAKIYPGGSGKGANPKNLGLSHELIRQTRLVLQYAPDLAECRQSARPRRQAANWREGCNFARLSKGRLVVARCDYLTAAPNPAPAAAAPCRAATKSAGHSPAARQRITNQYKTSDAI